MTSHSLFSLLLSRNWPTLLTHNVWFEFLRNSLRWCFLFVTLFNLQGTRRSRRNIAYFTKSFRICQVLFSKVFWHFRFNFALSATFLSYHNQFALSRTFLKVFNFARCFVRAATFDKLPHFAAAVKCFFLSLSGAVLTAPTALLEYQTVRQKSTLFLALCLLFLRRLSFFLIFGIYLTASLI